MTIEGKEVQIASTKNSRPVDIDVEKEVETQTKEIEKKLLQEL